MNLLSRCSLLCRSLCPLVDFTFTACFSSKSYCSHPCRHIFYCCLCPSHSFSIGFVRRSSKFFDKEEKMNWIIPALLTFVCGLLALCIVLLLCYWRMSPQPARLDTVLDLMDSVQRLREARVMEEARRAEFSSFLTPSSPLCPCLLYTSPSPRDS